MKPKRVIFRLAFIVLLVGCSALKQPRAMVRGREISNPSMGLFGFSFQVPEGFELYNPAIGTPEQYGEIQQLAIRIYNLNRDYHPRGAETFYDSFLMFSDNTAVLLMTLKIDDTMIADLEDSLDAIGVRGDQIALYNIREQETVELGRNRTPAVYSRGHAYERDGWYYARNGRKRNLFLYEACKASGGSRDRYVIMAFGLPDQEELLSVHMEQMMSALQF